MDGSAAAAFAEMADELEAWFASGPDSDRASFEDLALCCFELQCAANPLFRAFCERRGATPGSVSRWQEVPAVPASAFKHVDLVLEGVGEPEAVFRTSGTRSGREARGRHPVLRLSLYRASLLPGFGAHLLPDGERLPFMSLIPAPEQAAESSLSWMVGTAAAELADGVVWCTDEAGGPDVEAFAAAARDLVDAGRPALVLATAFALVGLMDELAERSVTVRLPPGSRLMETGGYKGRVRSVTRDELHETIAERLGLPPGRIVGEYGMTELLSQLWEPALRTGERGVFVTPPWLRVRALDPESLEELPAGQDGLLAFFDLANLGSVCHVLTEDVGSVSPSGVRLRGRAAGAEPRGCSLALEEILRARVDA